MPMDAVSVWPLTGLRLVTQSLELHFPSSEDLLSLAAIAAGGIHDPAVQPFTAAWTDQNPAQIALGNLQFHWARWASWTPEDWSLGFVAKLDGNVIGTQSISAKHFAVLREVRSGSYLGRVFQGRGLGTQMRAAVLHLAFAGLGAHYAVSSAYTDNAASLGVSRRLGYQNDGIERHVVRGRPAVAQRLRLSRDDWERHRNVSVEIHGLEACLPLMDLTDDGEPKDDESHGRPGA